MGELPSVTEVNFEEEYFNKTRLSQYRNRIDLLIRKRKIILGLKTNLLFQCSIVKLTDYDPAFTEFTVEKDNLS